MKVTDYKPTSYDHGIAVWLSEKADWLIVPVTQNRDSGCLDQSNFSVALAMLGGESDTVEIHRFGHWGPGWYEIIIAAPSRAEDVAAIVAKLENYPVLSDDDLSEREYNAVWESWRTMSMRERIVFAARNGHSVFAARHGPWECNNIAGDAVYRLINR